MSIFLSSFIRDNNIHSLIELAKSADFADSARSIDSIMLFDALKKEFASELGKVDKNGMTAYMHHCSLYYPNITMIDFLSEEAGREDNNKMRACNYFFMNCMCFTPMITRSMRIDMKGFIYESPLISYLRRILNSNEEFNISVYKFLVYECRNHPVHDSHDETALGLLCQLQKISMEMILELRRELGIKSSDSYPLEYLRLHRPEVCKFVSKLFKLLSSRGDNNIMAYKGDENDQFRYLLFGYGVIIVEKPNDIFARVCGDSPYHMIARLGFISDGLIAFYKQRGRLFNKDSLLDAIFSSYNEVPTKWIKELSNELHEKISHNVSTLEIRRTIENLFGYKKVIIDSIAENSISSQHTIKSSGIIDDARSEIAQEQSSIISE